MSGERKNDVLSERYEWIVADRGDVIRYRDGAEDQSRNDEDSPRLIALGGHVGVVGFLRKYRAVLPESEVSQVWSSTRSCQ